MSLCIIIVTLLPINMHKVDVLDTSRGKPRDRGGRRRERRPVRSHQRAHTSVIKTYLPFVYDSHNDTMNYGRFGSLLSFFVIKYKKLYDILLAPLVRSTLLIKFYLCHCFKLTMRILKIHTAPIFSLYSNYIL